MAKMMQKDGVSSEQQTKQLLEVVKSGMNNKQAKKLEQILGDAEAVNKLMESKTAQALMKNLMNQKQ